MYSVRWDIWPGPGCVVDCRLSVIDHEQRGGRRKWSALTHLDSEAVGGRVWPTPFPQILPVRMGRGGHGGAVRAMILDGCRLRKV